MARRPASGPGRTGADLIEFLNSAMRQRVLAPQTGADYILACTDILAFTQGENWRAVDLADLDLQKLRRRLQALKGDAQLGRYHERFEPALRLFFDHLGLDGPVPAQSPSGAEDPPPVPRPHPPARATKPRRRAATSARAPSTPLPKVVPVSPVPPVSPPMSTPTVLPHLFPVRDGLLAVLCLPSDLTSDEAGRLARYIESLAIPASTNGSAVRGATDSALTGNGH